MGIRGIFTHITDKEVYDKIDLVQESRNNNNTIEILVDFNSFQRDLNKIILRNLIKKFDNEYLSLLCSEYDIYSDAYVDFHNCLAEIGVKLVWIVDSVKAFDPDDREQKADIWTTGAKTKIEKFDIIMSGCSTKSSIEIFDNIFPLHNFTTIAERLKRNGAEVIQLLKASSDEFIASEFQRRRSYAILSNNTSFLLFPDCTIIFPQLIYTIYEDMLKLPFINQRNSEKIFKKPIEFRCAKVTQQKVIQGLRLRNYQQFIVLAMIKGTEKTNDYSKKLQQVLKLCRSPDKYSHITHVANYINTENITSENIFQIPGIEEFLNTNSNVQDSMKSFLNFYSLKDFNGDDNDERDLLSNYFCEKLSNLEISKEIFSTHFGFFSNEIIPEKSNESCLSISSTLQNIRSRIYPYILIKNKHAIYESRYRDSTDLFTTNIEHASIKTNEIVGKPNSESERQDGVVYGIDLFEDIWSHLEDGESLNFMRTFGIEIGFICYILRYFYKITHDINMRLSDEEFKALFAAVFYKYGVWKNISFQTRLSRDTFMRMKICPSERCLMIFSWFVEVYFHGKYLCGNAFNITEYFPSMETLFSSSVFIAFYENAMNDKNTRLSHLEESTRLSFANLQEQVVMNFKEEFDIITE